MNYASFCLIKRYAAPILVSVEYTQGSPDNVIKIPKVIEHYYYYYLNLTKICFINYNIVFFQNKVVIGRMPIMLRSCCCVLYNRDEAELAKLGSYDTFDCFINLLHFSFFYKILPLVFL